MQQSQEKKGLLGSLFDLFTNKEKKKEKEKQLQKEKILSNYYNYLLSLYEKNDIDGIEGFINKNSEVKNLLLDLRNYIEQNNLNPILNKLISSSFEREYDDKMPLFYALCKRTAWFGSDNPEYDEWLKLVKYMINNGADPNNTVCEHFLEEGRKPLHTAGRYKKNQKLAMLLIEYGASIDAQDKEGNTPLAVACYAGNIDMIKTFIEYGANVNTQDKDGRTIIHNLIVNNFGHEYSGYASHPYYPDFFEYKQGYSLDYSKLLKVMEILLKNGADPNIKDDMGKTPYDYIYEIKSSYHDEIVTLLNEFNKSLSDEEKIKQKQELLDKASKKHNYKLIKFLLSDNLLSVSKNVDIFYKDENGNTPFYYFIQNYDFKYTDPQQLECLNLFFNRGASKLIYEKDNQGLSPLYYLIKNQGYNIKDNMINNDIILFLQHCYKGIELSEHEKNQLLKRYSDHSLNKILHNLETLNTNLISDNKNKINQTENKNNSDIGNIFSNRRTTLSGSKVMAR